MHIAILGSGNVGFALAQGWTRAGHDVTFGSRRPEDPDLSARAASIGARPAPIADAVAAAQIVVLAVPGHAALETARSLGDLGGRILVDCANPIGPGLTLTTGDGPSLAEQIAGACPQARVVKCFNTTGAENMANPRYAQGPLVMPLCGDDADARTTVAGLCADLGFEPADLGPLAKARLLEPMALVWITLAMQRGWGRNFGFHVARR